MCDVLSGLAQRAKQTLQQSAAAVVAGHLLGHLLGHLPWCLGHPPPFLAICNPPPNIPRHRRFSFRAASSLFRGSAASTLPHWKSNPVGRVIRLAQRGAPVLWSDTMSTGTVKWFNSQKGRGFIQPNDGSKDVFVHISAVERAGIGNLNEGQKLSYDVQRGQQGKLSAENLKTA